MATSATLNTWLDQLSASIISKRDVAKQSRKIHQDAFRRHVKKHSYTYARTNQFEVKARLDGLEEKFQILSLDNLSDALRQRRVELELYEHHWLPDILDLFLHLSGTPANSRNLLELYHVPPRIGTPPLLTWNDLLADSPINPKDRLWRVPDFRNADDSDDDNETASSFTGSARSTKRDNQPKHTDFKEAKFLYKPHHQDVTSLTRNLLETRTQQAEISELQFIRESLFFLRGYTSTYFAYEDGRFDIKHGISVRGLDSMAMLHAATVFNGIRQHLHQVVSWISQATKESYMATMKSRAEHHVRIYHKSIDHLQQNFIAPAQSTIVSLSAIVNEVEAVSVDVVAIANLLGNVQDGDSVACMETLYSAVQVIQLCADEHQYNCLAPILAASLHAYLQPVIAWLSEGDHASERTPFFVASRSQETDPYSLWTHQFTLEKSGPHRPPKFLDLTLDQVFICGKTSAFLAMLVGAPLSNSQYNEGLPVFEIPSHQDIILPFAAAFEHTWRKYVAEVVEHRTAQLKVMLSNHCGFTSTLESLQQLYFRQNCSWFDELELKTFQKIDRCIDDWNDKYLLKNLLEDGGLVQISDSITIHSTYTSSRSMQSRRKSVRILSGLSFEYSISWPLANIIDKTTTLIYRRIALVLTQIRRAKYSLERIGYIAVTSTPLGEDVSLADQKFAQILGFILLNFVNDVYDHLMTTSIRTATETMHIDMEDAATVDEMILVHKTYITHLEYSCLAAPHVKTLRQSITVILDLCIRFSDLVSNSSKLDQIDSDNEAGSFISARSRSKSLRVHQYESDSEDDDLTNLGEGYSTFIVLDDDTTVVQELKKIKTQFEKQLKLLAVELKDMGKNGQLFRDLILLADRVNLVQHDG